MAELSKNRARVGTQDRPVYRRDGVLPRRMGPGESPQRRDNIDVSAGRRGDGGAAAVMQLARQINGAFTDVQQMRQQQYVYDEQQNAFKAVSDEALGKEPDAELMEESLAYKAAYSLSSMEDRMASAKPVLVERVDALIQNYEGADLAELMKTVDEEIEGGLRSVLTDEEGQLIDLGTAQAFAVASTRVSSLQDTLRTDARTVARGRIQQNGKTLETNRAVSELRANGSFDAAAMFDRLSIYGLTDDAATDVLYGVVDIIGVEDPGKAKQLAGQIAGIPTSVREVVAPGTVTTTGGTEVLKPTGRLPFAGRITSTMGDGRGHNGVDIDGAIGDPIEAPAGGRVVKVDQNARAGKFVVIDHGNGVTSSYSHLDGADVKEGDIIRPGQKFARIGNTGNVKRGPNGDGSHLHWVVRENDKLVDPTRFQFPEFTAEAPVVTATPASASAPVASMVLPAGLKLNPEQLNKFASLRGQLEERERILADRAQQETFKASAEELYAGMLGGKWPSDDTLQAMVKAGRLSNDVAYTFRNMRVSNERSERAEAQAAQDRAERQQEETASAWAARTAISWRMGEGPKTKAEFDRFMRDNVGRLGPGRGMLTNYSALQGAFTTYESLTTKNPDYKMYGGLINNAFGSTSTVTSLYDDRGIGKDQKVIAQNEYHRRVVTLGEDPSTAYTEVMKQFGKGAAAQQVQSLQQVTNDRAVLEERRRAAGIN